MENYLSEDSSKSSCEDCTYYFTCDYHDNFYEILSSSSFCDLNESDSSTTSIDYQFPESIIDSKNCLLSDEFKNITVDTDDSEPVTLKTCVPYSKYESVGKCLKCKSRRKHSPLSPFCSTCIKHRTEYFPDKPRPKRSKGLRMPNASNRFTNIEVPGQLDFEQSYSSNIHNDNGYEKNIDILSTNESVSIRNKYLCNICFKLPKNGIVHHGKIAHMYCCYSCAKKELKNFKKCQICNVKIKYVTKINVDFDEIGIDALINRVKLSKTYVENLSSLSLSSLENYEVCTTNVLPYFRVCLQCREENADPYYQYCSPCFRNRLVSLSVNKEPKRIKILQEYLSQKEIDHTDYWKSYFKDPLCSICFVNQSNGVFNHDNFSHIYCCYLCAKKVQKMSNKCPVCIRKLKSVTKLVAV